MKKIIAIFFVIGFLVYSQSLFNGFVWDDAGNLFGLKNLSDIFFYTWGPFFKPIFFISINLLEYFVGKNPFFFHLLQLLLHLINACLLFILFQHFFKRNISFILSIVFLVHPGISEAVLWISALQEPLFFLFGTVALLFLLNEEKRKNIIPIYIFLLLSILSKETGIVFIAIVLFYKIFVNKTYFRTHLLYYIFTLIIYLLLRVASVGLDVAQSPWVYNADFLTRIATVPSIIAKYLEIFILPINLQVFQLWWVRSINFSNFILPLIILITLLLFFGYLFVNIARKSIEKRSSIVFFGFWFLFGIIFHSNLYAIDMTFAERWFYLPFVGGLGLAGIIITESLSNDRRRKIFYIFCLLLIIMLSTRTFLRTFDWKSEADLYNHDYLVNPNNLGGQVLLADYYVNSGNLEKNLEFINKAREQNPQNENIEVMLAQYYLIKGDNKTAEKILLNTEGKTVKARIFLGYILINENLSMARKYLANSRKLFPKNQELIILSAITEEKLGNEQQRMKFIEMGRSAPFYSVFKDTYESLLKGNLNLGIFFY